MLEKKGFTLIELLVVMAIIGVMASVATLNLGRNEDRDVKEEKNRLTSFLREVQNKALAGDTAGVTLGANERLCGYGFHWYDNKTVKSYYRVATTLDTPCNTITNSMDGVSSHQIGDFVLQKNVTVGSFGDIFFSAPSGEVRVAGGSGGSAIPPGGFPIVLSKGSPAVQETITIFGSGDIK